MYSTVKKTTWTHEKKTGEKRYGKYLLYSRLQNFNARKKILQEKMYWKKYPVLRFTS
jgi:hypothetical protein